MPEHRQKVKKPKGNFHLYGDTSAKKFYTISTVAGYYYVEQNMFWRFKPWSLTDEVFGAADYF
jgi:hypothetical protein